MTTSLFSQNTEGIITYEQVIQIDTDRFPAEMREMVPPERKSTKQLFFTNEEGIYKSVKNQEDTNREVAEGNNRMRFRMRMMDENIHYTCLADQSTLNKLDIFGRVFLVEGDDEPMEWKITNDMKTVGSFQAFKATSMRDTIPVEAWFTPQIPVSLGPGSYRGLPGMILYVNVNNGKQTITATNLEIRSLTEDEKISPPDKGKRLTKEEFEQLRKEKMEEMREMGAGRGRMMRRN